MVSAQLANAGGSEPATVPGLWHDREARHIREAILGAPLHDDPSPYVYVENLFSAAAYASIDERFPTGRDVFREYERPRDGAPRHAAYEKRRDISLPDELQRLPAADRAFWSGLTAVLCSPAMARTLLERFPVTARARFGDLLDDPSFAEDRLVGSMIVNEHDPDYFLGPHTDRGEKVFAVVAYLPEREGLDELGTMLYRPLEPGFTCDGSAHHDPARFAPLRTLPYRPNSALIFARTDVMFHGVERLTACMLQNSRRRAIQMQFYLRNERPVRECQVSFQAEIAPTMPAGGETVVAYRLVNRAPSTLFSAFPHVTQVGYRWVDAGDHAGRASGSGAEALGVALKTGESHDGRIRVTVPRTPGRYLLRLSVVQDGVAWFDDIDPHNGAAAEISVWDVAGRTSNRDDVVPATLDVALGTGWYGLEHDGDAPFRWVENDAVLHVAALAPLRHALCVLVEPGPGVAPEPLRLTARIDGCGVVGTATVTSRQLVRFSLPANRPAVFTVVLHAEHGGTSSSGDTRVLNFRVFDVHVERFADVFPAWATPVDGFYPLERHAGSSFRWVCDDAVVALARERADTLRLDVEPGPSRGAAPFTLRVSGARGELVRTAISGRTTIDVPLRAVDGDATIALHADAGACAVEGDPRTLSYRVFAAEP